MKLSLLMIATLYGASVSAKDYRVCNTHDVPLFVAYALTQMYQDTTFGTFHNRDLRCKGWVTLAANDCQSFSFNDANHTLYLYGKDANGTAYYPEKNGRRFCIHYKHEFSNAGSVEIREHVTDGCSKEGQFAVPFYQVQGANFSF